METDFSNRSLIRSLDRLSRDFLSLDLVSLMRSLDLLSLKLTKKIQENKNIYYGTLFKQYHERTSFIPYLDLSCERLSLDVGLRSLERRSRDRRPERRRDKERLRDRERRRSRDLFNIKRLSISLIRP